MNRVLIYTALTTLLAGCASFQSVDALNSPTRVASTADKSAPSSRNTQDSLSAVYQRYEGTPYRYGGTDQRGFDCSGFINVAFSEAYGMSLPRTTEQLIDYGVPIRRDQLEKGDLVFFQISMKQLHAGIYTGNGRFIHSSTSKGVIESNLENQYWQNRYLRARRVL